MEIKDNIARLTQLFLFGRPPYLLEYEYRRRVCGYQEDRRALKQLIKDGLVEQVHKDSRTILFKWIGPVPPP